MTAQINLLITGASGYIGGTLLEDLISDPKYEPFRIFALVRTPEQVTAVDSRGVTPLQFNKSDKDDVKEALLDNDITAVVHLADGIFPEVPLAFVEALAAVKQKLGPQTVTRFINTTGAKIFSEFAGMTPDQFPLSDLGDRAYVEHRKAVPHGFVFEGAHQGNMVTLELGDSLGVDSYLLVPTMTYGAGRGFGNKLSGNQLVDILKIGHHNRKMLLISDPADNWPVCHLEDLVLLFHTVISSWLPSSNVVAPHGRAGGVYFAVTNFLNWKDVTQAIGSHLFSKGLLDSDEVFPATAKDLDEIATIIGVPREVVLAQTSGRADLVAENGKAIGWKPTLGLDYLMSNMAAESDYIMSELTRTDRWHSSLV